MSKFISDHKYNKINSHLNDNFILGRSRHVHGSPHLEHSYAASSNVATDVALEHVSPSTSFAESNPEPGTSRIRQHVKVDDVSADYLCTSKNGRLPITSQIKLF